MGRARGLALLVGNTSAMFEEVLRPTGVGFRRTHDHEIIVV